MFRYFRNKNQEMYNSLAERYALRNGIHEYKVDREFMTWDEYSSVSKVTTRWTHDMKRGGKSSVRIRSNI